jgi:hypothetical protein
MSSFFSSIFAIGLSSFFSSCFSSFFFSNTGSFSSPAFSSGFSILGLSPMSLGASFGVSEAGG